MSILDKLVNRLGYTRATTDSGKRPSWYLATGDAERYSMPDYSLHENQSELYARLSWIESAIDAVANRSATTKLNVKRFEGEKLIDIPNHPLETLLAKPNPIQSRHEMLYGTSAYYQLTGNAYWWLNKSSEKQKPDEIWLLPSSRVLPVSDGNMGLRGYKYDPGDGKTFALEPWEVVHFKRFNPKSMYVGLSLVESLAMTAVGDMAMQKHNTQFFGKNNARMPGFITFGDMITDSDWEELKKEINTSSDKRRFMLLRGTGEKGVNFIQNTLTQKDMEFLASRTFNKEEIYAVIAPGLASVLAVNATEANAKAGLKTLVDFAVWPMLGMIAEKITNNLVSVYGDNLIAEFDDIRITDRSMLIQEIAEYAKTHTVDEVRSKYYNDDPIGDERGRLFASQITAAMTEPEEQEQAQGDEPIQDENIDDDEPEDNKDVDKIKAELRSWEKYSIRRLGKKSARQFETKYIPSMLQEKINAGLESANNEHEITELFKAMKVRDKREPLRKEKEQTEDKLYKLMIDRWKAQAEVIQATAGMYKAQKAGIETPKTPKDDDFFMRLIRIFISGLSNGISLFESENTIGFDTTLVNEEAAAYAREYAFDFLEGIDKTTTKVLQNAFADFVETPGMTIGDLVDRLPFKPARAQRIAVTETTNIYATGQSMAGDEMQKQNPGVYVEDTWFTNNDDRVCDICGPLNGKSVKHGKPFIGGNGAEYEKPAAHVNCRCWMSSTTRIGKPV